MAKRYRRHRLAIIIAIVALSTAPTLGAQRRTDPRPQQASPQPPATVRAELAAVLLQSKKYEEAAREYSALLSRDQSNYDYRLGLARALAWGGHPREAERELRTLRAQTPQSATIDALLRSVREAMEPRAAEATVWVAERPDYAPYRLALARALADEHFARLAGAQYDTLLARGGIGQLPDAAVLRREQARAYLDAGDLTAGAARLRTMLGFAPTDTALRHELAVALVSSKRLGEGRAQYDTLLSGAPTAALFAERARLRLEAGDRGGAEYDLVASTSLGPTVAANLMLGDLYRERGDYGAARDRYRAALARVSYERGDGTAITAALAHLAREARPVAAFLPSVRQEPGWRVGLEGESDTYGVHYANSTLRRAIAVAGDAISVGVCVVHEYLGERSALRSIDLQAFGGEASLAGEVGYGPFLARLGVTGGGLHVPDARSIPVRSATAAAWLNAWGLAVETGMGPAYPSLLTTTAFRTIDGDNDALTERSTTGSLGGPFGSADFAASAQQSYLSDGNERRTLQVYLRYPLAPGLFLAYTATGITFADRSTRYWDPRDYMAHGVGLELADRRIRGLSLAVRALPGMAWTTGATPPPALPDTPTDSLPKSFNGSAFQMGASGAVEWRDPHWEAMAAVRYGRGRAGDYQRFGATLGFRVLP